MRRRGARLNVKPEFLTAFHGDLIDSLLEGFGPASVARNCCPRKLAVTKSRGVQTSPTSTRDELLAKRDRILQCTGVQLDAELGLLGSKKPKKGSGSQRRIEGQSYRQGSPATTLRIKSHNPSSLPPPSLLSPAPAPSLLPPPSPPPPSLRSPPSLVLPAPATPRANTDKHMTLKMDFESASATLSGRLVYKNKLAAISSQDGNSSSMENDARMLSMELATSLEKVLTKLVKAEDSCCETKVSIFMGDEDTQEKTRARRLPSKSRARQQGWNTPYDRTLAKNKRRLLKPGDRRSRKIWA